MNYEFPYIKNISDVLPAIANHPEIAVAEKDGYTVINYNVIMADTFPPIKVAGGSAKMRAERELHNKLRRECRGIIFDSVTGEILRRPFHKFFNVNERDETQADRVDLSQPHVILDKLDGSMIAPFIVNGQMIWGTKMGATDVAKPVEEFVANNPKYEQFARGLILHGMTPIFEWCSRKQRIVLDYQEDQLILTAIRQMRGGKYYTHEALTAQAEIYDIPVVRAFAHGKFGMSDFIKYVATLQDTEGFVVRFEDGHMTKLKCDWYVAIHKAKEKILHDRNIVEIILDEKLDDVKSHLPAEDRDRLTQFECDFNAKVLQIAGYIEVAIKFVQSKRIDRKTFALEHAQNFDGYFRPIIFKNFDDVLDRQKLEADVRNTIRNNLSKTVKYEAIRDAWFPGVTFNG